MPGTAVKIYYDNGETRDYMPRSMRWELDPSGVAVVTNCDTKTLNALTPNFQCEVFVVLEHAKRDPAVKAVVWAAEGKAWSSGAALKGDQTVHVPKDCMKQYAKRNMMPKANDMVMTNTTLAFWDFPKPSIAAIQGMAVGGAVNMALCNYHDLVFCSDNARFKYPFVKLGITLELASSRMLPFLVGYAKAKELIMCGEWFSAADAERLGLVNKVTAPGDLLSAAVGAAKKFAAEPNQHSLRLNKRALNSYLRADLAKVLEEENRTIREAAGGKTDWVSSVKSNPTKAKM